MTQDQKNTLYMIQADTSNPYKKKFCQSILDQGFDATARQKEIIKNWKQHIVKKFATKKPKFCESCHKAPVYKSLFWGEVWVCEPCSKRIV